MGAQVTLQHEPGDLADKLVQYPLTSTGVLMVRIVVDVKLKPEILDPQGRAVLGALGRLGLDGVADVRQGKQFILTFDGEVNDAILAKVDQIAESLLSNPVIEDYTVRVDR